MALNGGKNYVATIIMALMPPRQSKANPAGYCHYVEPFAGGLAVLLANNPDGISEVVNDLNKDLSTFWKTVQGCESFNSLKRLCEATPFSEIEWHDADPEINGDEEWSTSVVRAWRFYIRCRQSLAGRMDSFAPLSRTRTRRGMNEQASAWLTAIDGMPLVHARLKRVVILCRDAIDVIRQQDGPQTLYYCDPPYISETRTAPNIYEKEMTVEQHRNLLATLKDCAGKVMLSGYPSALYKTELEDCGWKFTDFNLPNNSASGATKRRMTERLWMNYG